MHFSKDKKTINMDYLQYILFSIGDVVHPKDVIRIIYKYF